MVDSTCVTKVTKDSNDSQHAWRREEASYSSRWQAKQKTANGCSPCCWLALTGVITAETTFPTRLLAILPLIAPSLWAVVFSMIPSPLLIRQGYHIILRSRCKMVDRKNRKKRLSQSLIISTKKISDSLSMHGCSHGYMRGCACSQLHMNISNKQTYWHM